MLEKIKLLMKVDDDSKDALISLYLDIVTNLVKNYCGIEIIPKELEIIVINILVNEFAPVIKDSLPVKGKVSSIKRGDMQISYSNREENNNQLTGAASFINNYRLQLDPFRRMKVPR